MQQAGVQKPRAFRPSSVNCTLREDGMNRTAHVRTTRGRVPGSSQGKLQATDNAFLASFSFHLLSHQESPVFLSGDFSHPSSTKARAGLRTLPPGNSSGSLQRVDLCVHWRNPADLKSQDAGSFLLRFCQSLSANSGQRNSEERSTAFGDAPHCCSAAK